MKPIFIILSFFFFSCITDSSSEDTQTVSPSVENTNSSIQEQNSQEKITISSIAETPFSQPTNLIISSQSNISSSSKLQENHKLRDILVSKNSLINVACKKRSLLVTPKEVDQDKIGMKCSLHYKGQDSLKYIVIREVIKEEGIWRHNFCTSSGCYNPKKDTSIVETVTFTTDSIYPTIIMDAISGNDNGLLDVNLRIISIKDTSAYTVVPFLFQATAK